MLFLLIFDITKAMFSYAALTAQSCSPFNHFVLLEIDLEYLFGCIIINFFFCDNTKVIHNNRISDHPIGCFSISYIDFLNKYKLEKIVGYSQHFRDENLKGCRIS